MSNNYGYEATFKSFNPRINIRRDLTVRDILNKLLWDSRENIADYELTFIHRGAPGDARTIPCSLIREVKTSWFTYGSEEEEETVIPFHRVLEIRNVATGKTIWRKRDREETKNGRGD